jgi:putative tryptophan/tyrosine transport system substrate-binding protein
MLVPREMKLLQAGALMIGADVFFIERSKQLAALTVRHAVPASFHFREFVMASGLMSYGGSITDAHRLVGVLAGRMPRRFRLLQRDAAHDRE